LGKPLDRRVRNREYDAKRREEKPYRNWYKLKRWQDIRDRQLAAKPLCERCEKRGKITPAAVCHHVIKHDGDPHIFWSGPFASSCQECHDTIEQGIEARGYEMGNDIAGRPIAPDHPWNRPKG